MDLAQVQELPGRIIWSKPEFRDTICV